MKVGFVGLGSIGSTMAHNLIQADHAHTIDDKTRSRAEELLPLDAAIVRTPAEAASGEEAFITTVAADNFEPVGFRVPLGMKDHRPVLAAAEEASVPMTMASLIRDRMLAAATQGMGETDWAAVAGISFREAGL